VRQSVQNQFGHSFSKEFTIASLQHLAKLICRSVGWPFGSDAVDICRASEKLASWLLEHGLPAFDEEERKHIKSKLQKLHRLVSQEDQNGIDWGNSVQSTDLYEGARQIQSVCSGQVSHLLTCRSANLYGQLQWVT